MLPVHGDVRPGPEDSPVMKMIGREVVREHFAVKAVERVNVAPMRFAAGFPFFVLMP